MVVLGIHDLQFLSSQTVSVDEVFNLPEDGSFPPKPDLSLLRLSVSARFSINTNSESHVSTSVQRLSHLNVSSVLSQIQMCLQSVSLMRTRSSMTAGVASPPAGA